MFIYSMHANTLKFLAALCLSLTLLIALIAFVPTYYSEKYLSANAGASYNYEKIRTADDRIAFLKQFGWEVEPEPVSEKEVVIPAEFDKIFSEYNELQRRQGLDLSAYKKKSVMRYTYALKGYPDYDGEVYVNILVYKNTVIAGDVCSADANGFVHGLELK